MFRLSGNVLALAAIALGAAAVAGGGFNGSARAVEAAGAADCAGQTWPRIDPACLVAVDGLPARAVRVIDAADGAAAPQPVLVRLPASN